MMHRLVASVALALALAYAAQPASAPDIVILNARVYTGDAARPWAEAVSIRANRIAAVGTTAEITASGNATRTIDAGGRLLIPGFNDAHAQPLLHAVGDGAIAVVLDALEDTGGERWKPLRPRTEHGDMLQAADFTRAIRMGVTIVQNPSHFMIGPLIQQRLGPERTARTDQVKAIIAAGVPFAIGSDGVLNPFLNIMFAMMNQTSPSQALTVEQAVAAYTRGSAAAEFAERQKGTIAPGMLADVALLSQDIFKIAAPDLPRTTSVLTIVSGRIVHEAK